MKNEFKDQFSQHINYEYSCFDSVILKGYIRKFFSLAAVVIFLKALGFTKRSKGVLRLLTDQLNDHVNSKSTLRLYDNNACVKHWFGKNSIKQYNKNGNFIRTETTIYNAKSLGLK